MPNPPVVSGAIIVVSVAVAAAIAVYESQQARQFAEDVRRRVAVALHSLGDEINPAPREPRFNRPEDAEGFMESTGNAMPGVEADEESRRRQREELMYWNAEKIERERRLAEARPASRTRGSSFDDFLQEDHTAEKGAYVYNTGADVHQESDQGLRNRGVKGLDRAAIYANPFGDEHHVDFEEQRAIDASLMAPEMSERLEVMSDLYNASEDLRPSRQAPATIAEQLIDISEVVPDPPVPDPSLDIDTNFTNMSEYPRDESAYASIHAWADNANSSFYSPLPVTPRAASPQQEQYQASPVSPLFNDPPISVPGDMTPTTDSASLAGSGREVWGPRSGATSEADIMSVDGEGISTPGSWTEVGSVVSENDVPVPVAVSHH
ncbi:Uncharacterized protein BP5553_08009 [Venustampulla echinocandica]|uniref:Uncharacterized protein n=1 Tax=Venustampulla echinocandica TaxID=2656787 RepID=A0A370TFI6_9HELO|nr:Uncharacterized protein BP5553_08009 [Venustampulla echinocandica]RDL33641.1 Uncharacterized protein BP5553_08009 [Venustampulla echinocandica]